MRVMSRDFTRSEKILILVLVLILLGLVYYQFVDRNVRETITSAESEVQMIQKEMDAVEKRLAELRKTKAEMDALEEKGMLSWMPSYNAGKEEVAFLNGILADTLEYEVTFSNVARTNTQIRRAFKLKYKVEGYEAAQAIQDRLSESKDRCLVGDVKGSIDKDGIVTVEQSATFYETMVGGVPDAGLPSDGAKANQ